MKRKQAFTLIELMVAMGVIAVISALSIFGVQQVLQAQGNTQRRKVLDNLDLSLSSYLNNNGLVPSSTSVDFSGGTVSLGPNPGDETTIKIVGSDADYCYARNSSNDQLYVTAVKLSGDRVECKGTWNGAPYCGSATTFPCN